MFGYLIGRLIGAALTVLLVTTFVFLLVRLSGDPVVLLADPYMTDEDVEELRADLGLDASLPVQYVTYTGNLLQGDFGNSLRYREPADELYWGRLPATLKLVAVASGLALVIAIPIGLSAGMNPSGSVDRLAKGLALLGQSVPAFWLGIMLMLLFAVQLKWLPTSGDNGLTSVILPGATLSAYSIAALMRVTRSSVLDVKEAEFVRLLYVKGLSSARILWLHVLRNSSIPVLTLASLQIVGFLSGAVIVEQIFAWPGVGRLAVDAVYSRDFPLIQAVVVINTLILVTVNIIVDVSYAVIDPRVRLTGGET